eukprot:184030-Amphidinium_carterae.1
MDGWMLSTESKAKDTLLLALNQNIRRWMAGCRRCWATKPNRSENFGNHMEEVGPAHPPKIHTANDMNEVFQQIVKDLDAEETVEEEEEPAVPEHAIHEETAVRIDGQTVADEAAQHLPHHILCCSDPAQESSPPHRFVTVVSEKDREDTIFGTNSCNWKPSSASSHHVMEPINSRHCIYARCNLPARLKKHSYPNMLMQKL